MNEFRVQQIVDDGKTVRLALIENVNTETVSQKQMIRESVVKRIDADTREHIMPLLDAILQAQPTIKFKSYHHTSISITMPRNRYDKMGRPQVGQIVRVDFSLDA